MEVLGGALCRMQIVEYDSDDHLLLLNIHHAVADGWSLEILHRDLARCYRDVLSGRQTIWGDTRASYDDYVATERHAAANGTKDAAVHRSLQRLRGAPASVNLPTDHPRPRLQDFRGATLTRPLKAETVKAVRHITASAARSPFVVGLGTFAETIRRMSGDDDLVIGVPVLGRSSAAFEDVVGMFVNTVPVRIDLTGTRTLGSVADRAADAWSDTLDDHLAPLDEVVAGVTHEHVLSRSPLFQVTFAYAEEANEELELEGTETVPVNVSSASAKFDLGLTLRDDGGGGMTMALEYSTTIFEIETATRVLNLFERLLVDTAHDPGADPRKRLHLLPGALPKTPAWEDEPLDETWPHPRHVLDLVKRAAQRCSTAIAVRDSSSSLSYGELVAEITSVASRLQAQGLGPGDRIGVMMRRTPQLVSALLGVWEAGCSYVPLDPGYPDGRSVFMMQDAGCRALIVDDSIIVSAAMREQADVILFDGTIPKGMGMVLSTARQSAPAHVLEQEAYVLYTSGSTGVPKGVSVPHRAISSMVYGTWRVFGTTPIRNSLAAASVSFDPSALEIYPTLSIGGTVYLADSLLDIPDFPGKPTFVVGVPTLFSAALEIGALDVSGVVVASGGEELSRELVDKLFASGARRVFNVYGPSEDCAYSTAAVIQEDEFPPIGRSIPGSHMYVADEDGFLVAPGAVGEIYLAGAGLAHGYAGRSALTADRFIPDAYADEPGARVYRTGDLGRIRHDGGLAYVGRADRQVKVNGMRIELGEVEAALRSLPHIEACVVVVQRSADSSRLAAAVVSDRTVDQPMLRRELARRLPQHLVPGVLTQLDTLPRLSNGKTDTATVLKLMPSFGEDFTAPGAMSRLDEPRGVVGEVEAAVRSIWRDLLPGGSAYDDFFADGGTSMSALRLALRLKDKYQIAVSLADVFEARSAERIATVVEAAPPLPEIAFASTNNDECQPGHIAPRRLSPEQTAIWWMEQAHNAGASYVIPLGWLIEGPVDVEALTSAVSALQRRHPLLRHRLDTDSAVPSTRLHDPVSLRLVNLSVETSVESRFDAFADEPFDFEGGSLFAIELWCLREEEHVLVLKVHHLIVDGWSMGILEQDLATFYSQALNGEDLLLEVKNGALVPAPDPLPAHAVQRRAHELAGAPTVLNLGPRPNVRSSDGTSMIVNLSEEADSAFDSLVAGAADTPFVVGSLVQALALMSVTGERDVLLGTPVAARDQLAFERVVGMFVTTTVLRIDARHDPSLKQLLTAHSKQIADVTRTVVSLDALVDAIGPERQLGVNPLVQVFFAYDEGGAGNLALEGTRTKPLSTLGSTAKFDLFVTLDASFHPRRLIFEYATDLLTEQDIINYAERFERLAVSAAANTERTIKQVLVEAGIRR